MPYSKVIDVRDCIVSVSSDTDEKHLEPGRVLSALPIDPTAMNSIMVVRITDGTKSVEYETDTFLSKTYPIRNDSIRFGSVAIKVNLLSIMVGWKFLIEDLRSITEPGLD